MANSALLGTPNQIRAAADTATCGKARATVGPVEVPLERAGALVGVRLADARDTPPFLVVLVDARVNPGAPDPEKRMVVACYDPRCQPKLDWRREAGVCICERASRRQRF